MPYYQKLKKKSSHFTQQMTCSVNKPLFGSLWYVTKEVIPSFNFQICWSDKVKFWDAQLWPHSVPTVISVCVCGGLSQGQSAVAKTPHRQFLPRGVVLSSACRVSCRTVSSGRFSRTDLCGDDAGFRIDWITYATASSRVDSELNLFVFGAFSVQFLSVTSDKSGTTGEWGWRDLVLPEKVSQL